MSETVMPLAEIITCFIPFNVGKRLANNRKICDLGGKQNQDSIVHKYVEDQLKTVVDHLNDDSNVRSVKKLST